MSSSCPRSLSQVLLGRVPGSRRGAGIREHPARAAGDATWIPGLALLARNDAPPAIRQRTWPVSMKPIAFFAARGPKGLCRN